MLWRDTAPVSGTGQQQATPPAAEGGAATAALSERVVAAEAPGAAEEVQPEAQPPGFDVVRVTDDGAALIAGQGAPGELIALYLDDAQIAESLADGQGNFVIMLRLEPSAAPQVLSLAAVSVDGTRLAGRDVVVLAARMGPAEAPLDPEAVPEGPEPRAELAQTPGEAEAVRAELAPARELAELPATTATTAGADAEAGIDMLATRGQGALQADPAPAETVLPVAERASEAGPATQTAAAPRAQADFLLDSEGRVRVLDPTPDLAGNVTIEAISYGLAGTVLVSGRSSRAGRSPITLYLDNRPVASTWAEDGVWTLALRDVAPGVYRLRADEMDADGRVVSRVETPFLREDPLAVARLLGDGQTSEAPRLPVAADAPSERSPAATMPGAPARRDAAPRTRAEPDERPAARASDLPAVAPRPGHAAPRHPQEPAPDRTVPAVPTVPSGASVPVAAPGSGSPGAAIIADPPEIASRGAMRSDAPQPAPTNGPGAADRPSVAGQSASAAAGPPAQLAATGVQLITVQPGHTLWGISDRHYGDGALYVQIFHANRDQIRDPHWIYPGQIFALPD